MNENPRFGRVQTLVFAKRFSPFCFFESHFILRKQKRKNRTIPRLFDIKMRPKLGCLIFEFQISTSIQTIFQKLISWRFKFWSAIFLCPGGDSNEP